MLSSQMLQKTCNAKMNLDGHLFKGCSIQILFSNSGLAPNKLDNLASVAEFTRSEMYSSDGCDNHGIGV